MRRARSGGDHDHDTGATMIIAPVRWTGRHTNHKKVCISATGALARAGEKANRKQSTSPSNVVRRMDPVDLCHFSETTRYSGMLKQCMGFKEKLERGK